MENETLTRLKLIIYFLSAFLIASSIGLNAVSIPLFLEHNTDIFGPLFSTIILSTESIIAIVICVFIFQIINQLGIYMSLVIFVILRVLALLGMAFYENVSMWLILSILVGGGSFFCLMVIQLCINHLEVKRFKGIIYALFGTVISLGIATGPLIYSHWEIISIYMSAFMGEYIIEFIRSYTNILLQHEQSKSLVISAIITLLFAGPLLLNPAFLPKIRKLKSFSILNLIDQNKGVLFAVALCGISFFGASWYITVYGIRNGLSPLDAPLLLTAFMLGSVCLDTPISTISEYFDRRFVLVYCALICTILVIFLPLAIYQKYQAYGLLFLWGGLTSSMYSNCLILLENKYGTDHALASSTVFVLMENAGAAGGLILIGFIVHLIGTDGFSYVIIFANMVYFSFVLISYKPRE